MAIKKTNRDPRASEFNYDDIIINDKDGGLFYKTENNVLNKIPGTNTPPSSNDIIGVNKSYQMVYFAANWSHHNYEKAISWNDFNENSTLNVDDCYLFPFGGTIHSLFFKIAGKISKIKIKVYSNLIDLDSAYGMSSDAVDTSISSLKTQSGGAKLYSKTITPQAGQGNGVGFKRNMTRVNLGNIRFKEGEHAVVTLQKDHSTNTSAVPSIDEIFGQMLVSHNIVV